jgi:hypothetical protein
MFPGLHNLIPRGKLTDMWKPIPDFPLYEALPDGRIRSWKKKVRRWRNPDLSGRRTSPREMKGFIDARGYRSVILQTSKGLKRMTVHRLIALTFIPNTKRLSDVAHLNGKPSDNRVKNLAWMSHRDNQLMMRGHGTQSVTCKLTAEQVRSIREQVAKGPRGTMRRLAKEYGVQPPAITRIIKGQRWKTYW